MFRNTRQFSELPAAENGYELDPFKSFFSFVLPPGVDKLNLITNPSWETNTTGYTGVTGTLTRDTGQQERGLYSGKIVPTGNSAYIRYDAGLSLVAGTTYYFSVDVLAPAGVPMQIQVTDTGDVALGGSYSFIAQGQWQRVSLAYAETASNTRRVRVVQNNSSNRNPIYTDGWQVEQDTLTTYIDGDQVGFVRNRADYYWNGTAHGSTSTRISQSRHGGRVIPFSDFGYHVSGILGLGMAGRINQLLPLARGGAYYGGSTMGDRQFALTGILYGNALPDLQRKRKQIIDIIKDDVVSPDQPLRLFYQQFDEDSNPTTPVEEIICIVDGDPLMGRVDNLFTEAIAMTFRILSTYAIQETGNAGISLNLTSSVANANGILQRSAAGAWAAMGTGVNAGSVRAILRMPNGDIIAGGSFATMGGVANTAGIARWDGVQWNAMGTGVSAATQVNALAVDAAGTLYAGGTFVLMGGVAATPRIAKWNGTAWSAMGTGATGTGVNALAVDASNRLWAGGTITLFGGVANTQNVGYWDIAGGAWTALASGNANAAVNAFQLMSNGDMVVGGAFTTGVTTWGNGLSRFTSVLLPPTNYPGLLGGTASILTLATAPDGTLYAGGDFTTGHGGITTRGIEYFQPNLTTALTLNSGVGVAGGTAIVNALAWDPILNVLWLGGGFTSFNGTALAGIGKYNPTLLSISALDVAVPGSSVASILLPSTGTAYLGFSSNGTATGSGQTTVTNTGTASAGFRLLLTGPMNLAGLFNATTGKLLYFNLVLAAGETAILDLSDPTAITFVTSLRPNVLNTITLGSIPTDFNLISGTNNIILSVTGTTGATTAALIWRITHHSIDGAIPVSLGL